MNLQQYCYAFSVWKNVFFLQTKHNHVLADCSQFEMIGLLWQHLVSFLSNAIKNTYYYERQCVGWLNTTSLVVVVVGSNIILPIFAEIFSLGLNHSGNFQSFSIKVCNKLRWWWQNTALHTHVRTHNNIWFYEDIYTTDRTRDSIKSK